MKEVLLYTVAYIETKKFEELAKRRKKTSECFIQMLFSNNSH